MLHSSFLMYCRKDSGTIYGGDGRCPFFTDVRQLTQVLHHSIYGGMVSSHFQILLYCHNGDLTGYVFTDYFADV